MSFFKDYKKFRYGKKVDRTYHLPIDTTYILLTEDNEIIYTEDSQPLEIDI